MDFLNQPERFAHVPKDILTDPRLSLQAKGLYSVICTFTPDEPVSLGAVAQLLEADIDAVEVVWDEMVSFMNLKEKEEELKKALLELMNSEES